MRVLIVWIYSNTTSLFLAWLMHLSMTASLVVLDPIQLSPAQETLWYWLVAAAIALRYGKRLVCQPAPARTAQPATE
jgi:hypothetical protein